MNKTLQHLTAKATANANKYLINPVGSNEIDDKELEKFRDKIRSKIGINDLFIYFIFIPTTLLFICELDSPEKLTKRKKRELLDQLGIYEHREIESEKELFLIFDMGVWL
jgi:hypothetical protein